MTLYIQFKKYDNKEKSKTFSIQIYPYWIKHLRFIKFECTSFECTFVRNFLYSVIYFDQQKSHFKRESHSLWNYPQFYGYQYIMSYEGRGRQIVSLLMLLTFHFNILWGYVLFFIVAIDLFDWCLQIKWTKCYISLVCIMFPEKPVNFLFVN